MKRLLIALILISVLIMPSAALAKGLSADIITGESASGPSIQISCQTDDASLLDGIEIRRSHFRLFGYLIDDTSSTDTYEDTDVSNGHRYYYRIRGYILKNGKKQYTDWIETQADVF